MVDGRAQPSLHTSLAVALDTFILQCTILHFSVRLLLFLHGHSLFFSSLQHQPITFKFEEFLSQTLSIIVNYLNYSPILILDKEPVFPFKCWVLNKGTTGTIFISSLVWRGPWLGMEQL